jgi:2,4-dienoyl-CoA reductase-like NADH-dependent reductase (Old Yellow Enzyme family)
MTGAVGLITEAKQAEEIVASGKADMVLFLENHCVI